MSMLKNKSEE